MQSGAGCVAGAMGRLENLQPKAKARLALTAYGVPCAMCEIGDRRCEMRGWLGGVRREGGMVGCHHVQGGGDVGGSGPPLWGAQAGRESSTCDEQDQKQIQGRHTHPGRKHTHAHSRASSRAGQASERASERARETDGDGGVFRPEQLFRPALDGGGGGWRTEGRPFGVVLVVLVVVVVVLRVAGRAAGRAKNREKMRRWRRLKSQEEACSCLWCFWQRGPPQQLAGVCAHAQKETLNTPL